MLRSSMGFFPLLGLVLGLAVWFSLEAISRVVPRVAAAIVVLALYTLATGALHVDGLADTFDALGSWKTSRQDSLAVMKDSRLGIVGAVALLLRLLGKAAAFSHIPLSHWGAWFAIPALSRLAVVWCGPWFMCQLREITGWASYLRKIFPGRPWLLPLPGEWRPPFYSFLGQGLERANVAKIWGCYGR